VTACNAHADPQQARIEPGCRRPYPPDVTSPLPVRDGSREVRNRFWRRRCAAVRSERAQQPGRTWTRHQRN
jgi:hypothetical protein